ncbi:MAG: ABC-F family ATP-binding cassette domain-containing protein, partial [Pseudomonadota bacterium]
MLHVVDLTYRIDGRLLLDQATVGLPNGARVGLVGRNGCGKSTLLKLITGELSPDGGEVSIPPGRQLGYVAQDALEGPQNLLEAVLEGDRERAALLKEAESATDPHRIADIQVRLADIDAHSAPARAARILAGLGFDEAAQARSLDDFSGGWRMRVALARVLFQEPDLLLLDEPTNYLDLEGTLWLETHLRRYPHTVLLVSHDRSLLNKAVDSIVHLQNGKLTFYRGDYDTFERVRAEQQALSMKLKAKQTAERRRIEAFVERFRAKASKAKQAQSRLKALARMQPDPEHVSEGSLTLTFQAPASLPPPLIVADDAEAGYTGSPNVLSRLTFRVDADDRIALLGANGNGKSTLAKLLSGRLAATGGRLRRSKKMSVGYFSQHQLDELDGARSVYQEVRSRMGEEATEAQIRTRAGGLGFKGQHADTPIAALSGGEKARLLLGLIGHEAPHLLILDEPTNHLDVEMRARLIDALNGFEGAVLLISHDRYLVEACADRLWLVAAGTVKTYDGDMDSYRSEILESRAERGPAPSRPGEAPPGK